MTAPATPGWGEVQAGLFDAFAESRFDPRDGSYNEYVPRSIEDAMPRLEAFVRAERDRLGIRPWQPEDGDSRCQECGRQNVVWFTDSAVWNQVMPNDGVLCVPCFIERAEVVLPDPPPSWRVEPEGRDRYAERAAERDRVRGEFLEDLERLVAHYPADVFPADSETREGIAGTALRLVIGGLVKRYRESWSTPDPGGLQGPDQPV